MLGILGVNVPRRFNRIDGLGQNPRQMPVQHPRILKHLAVVQIQIVR